MTPITYDILIMIRDGVVKVNPTEGQKMAEELLTLRKLKLIDVKAEPVVKPSCLGASTCGGCDPSCPAATQTKPIAPTLEERVAKLEAMMEARAK